MEAKLKTFKSPGRADVRKLNFMSLAVKAEQKVESELHIVFSLDRDEMRKWIYPYLESWQNKCGR